MRSVFSSLCLVGCGDGLWSSARSTGKMKIPVCAGFYYVRCYTSLRHDARRPRCRLKSALRWPQPHFCPSPRNVFYVFFTASFFLDESRDVIFQGISLSPYASEPALYIQGRENIERGCFHGAWYNKAFPATKYFLLLTIVIGTPRYFTVLKRDGIIYGQ